MKIVKKGDPGVIQNVMMSLILTGVAGLAIAIIIAIVGTMSSASGLPAAASGALTNTTVALATFPNNWLSLLVLGVCGIALLSLVLSGIYGFFGREKR
jgi:hypothetical protein